VVVHTWSPSYSGGWGRQVAWAQEFEDIARYFHESKERNKHKEKILLLPPLPFEHSIKRILSISQDTRREIDPVGSWSGTSSHQNCEKTNFYSLNYPVYGTLLWQHKQIDVHHLLHGSWKHNHSTRLLH
jgi:hypothetical protein